MRIGIVTQPLRNNYGGLLQNWALQQVLIRMGHEPITLNYESCIKLPPFYRRVLSHVKTLILWFYPNRRRPFFKYERFNRSTVSQKFIDKYINVTHPVKAYNNRLVNEYKFDCIITGSDQVWRPMYNFHIDKMFLSFVKSDILKVTYAASFGVSNWEYSAKEENLCRKSAKRINAISVREKSGVVLCKKYFDVDAVHVLDPTLLLNGRDYEELTKVVPKETDAYMLAYILDQTDENRAQIERLGRSMDLPVKIVGADGEMETPVEEWIAMFRDAAFVVTNSFHGTVFSIIHRKPFVSLCHESRGGERFTDLLGQVGLTERLLAEIPENIDEMCSIDWENVEQILESRRQFSVGWLKDNLSCRL